MLVLLPVSLIMRKGIPKGQIPPRMGGQRGKRLLIKEEKSCQLR